MEQPTLAGDSAEKKMQLFHWYKAYCKLKAGLVHYQPKLIHSTFTGSISPLV